MSFAKSHHQSIPATYKGIPATPKQRLALGELSNYVRQSGSLIQATPKLRSNLGRATTDTDEYEDMECIRQMKNEECYSPQSERLSRVLIPAENLFELSEEEAAQGEDDEYPPVEHMFISQEDKFNSLLPDAEEEEMFGKIIRQEDLAPLYVSGSVQIFRNGDQQDKEEELDYEPIPDASMMMNFEPDEF